MKIRFFIFFFFFIVLLKASILQAAAADPLERFDTDEAIWERALETAEGLFAKGKDIGPKTLERTAWVFLQTPPDQWEHRCSQIRLILKPARRKPRKKGGKGKRSSAPAQNRRIPLAAQVALFFPGAANKAKIAPILTFLEKKPPAVQQRLYHLCLPFIGAHENILRILEIAEAVPEGGESFFVKHAEGIIAGSYPIGLAHVAKILAGFASSPEAARTDFDLPTHPLFPADKDDPSLKEKSDLFSKAANLPPAGRVAFLDSFKTIWKEKFEGWSSENQKLIFSLLKSLYFDGLMRFMRNLHEILPTGVAEADAVALLEPLSLCSPYHAQEALDFLVTVLPADASIREKQKILHFFANYRYGLGNWKELARSGSLEEMRTLLNELAEREDGQGILRNLWRFRGDFSFAGLMSLANIHLHTSLNFSEIEKIRIFFNPSYSTEQKHQILKFFSQFSKEEGQLEEVLEKTHTLLLHRFSAPEKYRLLQAMGVESVPREGFTPRQRHLRILHYRRAHGDIEGIWHPRPEQIRALLERPIVDPDIVAGEAIYRRREAILEAVSPVLQRPTMRLILRGISSYSIKVEGGVKYFKHPAFSQAFEEIGSLLQSVFTDEAATEPQKNHARFALAGLRILSFDDPGYRDRRFPEYATMRSTEGGPTTWDMTTALWRLNEPRPTEAHAMEWLGTRDRWQTAGRIFDGQFPHLPGHRSPGHMLTADRHHGSPFLQLVLAAMTAKQTYDLGTLFKDGGFSIPRLHFLRAAMRASRGFEYELLPPLRRAERHTHLLEALAMTARGWVPAHDFMNPAVLNRPVCPYGAHARIQEALVYACGSEEDLTAFSSAAGVALVGCAEG